MNTDEEMISNEIIVEEGVSQFGLHRLHVIRMGAPVDIKKWIVEKVLAVDGIVETFYRYEEKELNMHHLRLYWREMQNIVTAQRIGGGDGE